MGDRSCLFINEKIHFLAKDFYYSSEQKSSISLSGAPVDLRPRTVTPAARSNHPLLHLYITPYFNSHFCFPFPSNSPGEITTNTVLILSSLINSGLCSFLFSFPLHFLCLNLLAEKTHIYCKTFCFHHSYLCFLFMQSAFECSP